MPIKAERYKSKKDGRVLPMFQLEVSDPVEAEALLSQNLMCNVTGIVYKVEEFRQPVSVRQCFNCQCFGHSAQNCKSKQKCVICGENHSHKGCPKKKQNSPNVQTVLGHMLHLTKGVLNTKAGFQATCGEPPKILCRSSRPKYSPTAQNHANVLIYSRTAHQIRSKCGHSNRQATGLLPQS